MKLAGIELRYLVDHLSGATKGYYVSNIYGVSRESMLFKLHHPEKPDIMLMFSTFGLWASSVRIEQIEVNRLLRRFRKDLLRLRLNAVEQLGTERIAYLRFGGFDKEYVLVGEFFGDGNIILCNTEMKILALLHSLDVRHRSLTVGATYEPPPQNGLDVFSVTAGELDSARTSQLDANRWLGRTLGLPKRYVEQILRDAGMDPKTACQDLSSIDLEGIVASIQKITGKVATGDHDPCIVGEGDAAEVYPVNPGGEARSVPGFMEGLDELFTQKILASGRDVQSQGTDGKIRVLETRLGEQERAVGLVKERSRGISNLARALLALVTGGGSPFMDARVKQVLGENGATYTVQKGVPIITIQDEKVKIDPDSSLHAIASVLFDEAKKQSGAIREIERQYTKTEKEIAKLRAESEGQKEAVSFSEVRRKNWYERYRWFFTTDGHLAIGGRDASSNSSIIRKHLEKDDLVFHADVFGSPFFILKGGKDAMPASLNETAHATVCFSRAWREAMYGVSAYWVRPEQVKRAAPSGQFLPKGSFTIDGQRNFVRVPTLGLALGITERDGGHLLSCGPPEAIRQGSIMHVEIRPSGMEMAEAAKRIRTEFVRMDGDITKQISLDDFVRVLPAGKSHIEGTGGRGAR